MWHILPDKKRARAYGVETWSQWRMPGDGVNVSLPSSEAVFYGSATMVSRQGQFIQLPPVICGTDIKYSDLKDLVMHSANGTDCVATPT